MDIVENKEKSSSQKRKDRIKRSEYSQFKRKCDQYRSQDGITIEVLAKALGFVQENGSDKRQGQESRLSQYETRLKGPPLELVEMYAGHFNLEASEKYDLFRMALEASGELRIDMGAIHQNIKNDFIRFVTAALLCGNLCIQPACKAGPFGQFAVDGRLNAVWTEMVKSLNNFIDTLKKFEGNSHLSYASSTNLTKARKRRRSYK